MKEFCQFIQLYLCFCLSCLSEILFIFFYSLCSPSKMVESTLDMDLVPAVELTLEVPRHMSWRWSWDGRGSEIRFRSRFRSWSHTTLMRGPAVASSVSPFTTECKIAQEIWSYFPFSKCSCHRGSCALVPEFAFIWRGGNAKSTLWNLICSWTNKENESGCGPQSGFVTPQSAERRCQQCTYISGTCASCPASHDFNCISIYFFQEVARTQSSH